jgi:hypothetical protein
MHSKTTTTSDVFAVLLNQIAELDEDNKRMREALQEIRDVAACSEDVEWYVMIADRGLGNAV